MHGPRRYWLILPAAGRGKRLGASTPKQYLTVVGRTLLEWALQPFLQDAHCEQAVVALSAADPHWATLSGRLPRPVQTVPGGAERSDSVRLALQHLKENGVAGEEWVLVHDAARPCVSVQEITALCQAVWQLGEPQGHAGGLLALPMSDTLRRGELEGGQVYAAQTLPREGLWRALTPQMFRLDELWQALEAARESARVPTDEAQAMEWQGKRALLVAGEATNIKVTTQSDLSLVEGVLSQRMARASGAVSA